jgi:hypothetical protein
VLRVAVFAEGKAVPRLEPAVVGMAARGGRATFDHGESLQKFDDGRKQGRSA